MNRPGPTLAPEWLRPSNGSGGSSSSSAGGSSHNSWSSHCSDDNGSGRSLRNQSVWGFHEESSSNHNAGSSNRRGEHGSGRSSRNRSSRSSSENGSPRSSSSMNRGSFSFNRSTSSNGSLVLDRDSSALSQPYSSFGRSHRDRDRHKDSGRRDRNRSSSFVNGFHDSSDSVVGSRDERDILRHPQSMMPGKPAELWPKGLVDGSSNGSLPVGSLISGMPKNSFERDFPSLGAEDKQGDAEIDRVPSPVLSNTAQSLPVGSLAKLKANVQTSSLVVPGTAGSNEPIISSATDSATVNVPHTASSTPTGLNMAETLAQVPLIETQLPSDTEKVKELARKRDAKLIPLTHSATKGSAVEKSKGRATRGGELVATSRAGQHSFQQTNNTQPASAKPDASKTSTGNFQILTRGKNGITSTAKESQTPTNASRDGNPVINVVPSAVNTSLITPINPKLRADSGGDKRPPSQSQLRSDFFNSIRNQIRATPEPPCPLPPCTGERSSEEITEVVSASILEKETYASTVSIDGSECGNGEMGGCEFVEAPENQEKESSASTVSIDCSEESGNCQTGGCESLKVPEDIVSDNGKQSVNPGFYLDPVKEAALLQMLGWEENEAEEPLTEEEIASFVEKCKRQDPTPKSERVLRVLQ